MFQVVVCVLSAVRRAPHAAQHSVHTAHVITMHGTTIKITLLTSNILFKHNLKFPIFPLNISFMIYSQMTFILGLYSAEWQGDQLMRNWKGSGRKGPGLS